MESAVGSLNSEMKCWVPLMDPDDEVQHEHGGKATTFGSRFQTCQEPVHNEAIKWDRGESALHACMHVRACVCVCVCAMYTCQ